MNKLALILLLFFNLNLEAKPALVKPKEKIVKNEQLKEDTTSIIPLKFKENLKEKYNANEFQYEIKVAEKGAWDRFKEWLKKLFENLFGIKNGVSANAVDWTINIVSILLILVVVYLIAKAILNKEGQWIFGKSTTKKVISHEDIERNLKNVDFEKLISETIKTGDKRLVIRYYYLWLLKKLSEKSIIDWNVEKTNSDYLYEIKSDKLKNDFSYTSYLYNYIWYGEFSLDETTFEEAKKSFIKTIQSI